MKAIERGYLYRHVPRATAAREQAPDPLKSTIIAEEFRRAKAPGEVVGQGPSMLVPTLVEHGTEAQKQYFVRDTLLGKISWCQGYSEPGSGCDLASLRTRAVLDGDFWVVNGQKIWTSNAGERGVDVRAGAHRAGGAEARRHQLPADRHEDARARRAAAAPDDRRCRLQRGVLRQRARADAKNLVGPRGKGWIVSRSTLKHERALIGGSHLTRRTFDGVVMLAQALELRGKPAIKDPVIRNRLVELEARLLASEYNGYRLLTMQARGEEPGLAGAGDEALPHAARLRHRARRRWTSLGDRGVLAPGEPSAPAMGMFVLRVHVVARRPHRRRHRQHPAQHHRRARPRAAARRPRS